MYNLKDKDKFFNSFVGFLIFKGKKGDSVKFIDKVCSIIKNKRYIDLKKENKLISKNIISPMVVSFESFNDFMPHIGIKRLQVGRSKKNKRYIYIPTRLNNKRKIFTGFEGFILQDKKKKGRIFMRGVSVNEVADNFYEAFIRNKRSSIMRRQKFLLDTLIREKYRMKRLMKKGKIIYKEKDAGKGVKLNSKKYFVMERKKRSRRLRRLRNIALQKFLKARRKRKLANKLYNVL